MNFYVLSPFLLQSLIWTPCRILLAFFTRLKISGLENIKKIDRGVIFASNHTSELDPILIPASLPFLSKMMPMFYVSKQKSFYEDSGWRQLIYGGIFFKSLGAYPTISGKKNYEIALTNHIAILNDQRSIIIFPEGQRYYDGVARKARGGVTYLSHKTGTPIVPVKITGAHMTFTEFIMRKKKIEITFGMPVYPRELFQAEPQVNEYNNDFVEAATNVMGMVGEL